MRVSKLYHFKAKLFAREKGANSSEKLIFISSNMYLLNIDSPISPILKIRSQCPNLLIFPLNKHGDGLKDRYINISVLGFQRYRTLNIFISVIKLCNSGSINI